MQNEQALVPVTSLAKRSNGNSTEREATSSANAAPLTDELIAGILAGRGLRGWLRAARVARVLGLFTLYLFLDTYHIRADFNRRMAERLRAEAKEKILWIRLQARLSEFLLIACDKLVRATRLFVFRGREGSENKAARLQRQAEWLRRSLIDLGPTFIKIGPTLGTRADRLPLA